MQVSQSLLFATIIVVILCVAHVSHAAEVSRCALQDAEACLAADAAKDDALVLLQKKQAEKIPALIPLDVINTLGHTSHRRQPGEKACGIIWYYDIPRTGTSVKSWFDELTSKGIVNNTYKLATQGPADGLRAFLTDEGVIQYDAWEENFLAPVLTHPEDKLVVVYQQDRGPGLYGMQDHFKWMQKQLNKKGCSLFRITFLREPEALTTANLLFNDMMEQDSKGVVVPNYIPPEVRHEKDRMNRVRTKLLMDKLYDNLMVRYLLNNNGEFDGSLPRGGGGQYPMELGTVDERAVQEALKILKDFDYVGTTMNMNKGMQHIANITGLPPPEDLAHISDMYDVQIDQFPDDVKEIVQDRVQQDKSLYEAAVYLNNETSFY